MLHATLANATDLKIWTQRLEARHQLPRLVRRLIHATVPRVQDIGCISVPADESVQLPGWDGIVRVETGNAWVPVGGSVWEMGVDSGIKGKADRDYKKRSQNSLGLNRAEITFVFVTPHLWANKRAWMAARNAENIWHDVRAYDGEDLAQWLEQAPAVHLWISALLGKYLPGVVSLEIFWTDWSGATEPPLSAGLVIGGREEARQQLLSWLRESTGTLTLQGDSSEEAIAFLAAVVYSAEDAERMTLLSRAVVVEDLAAWRSLILSPAPLLLIARMDAPEGVARAVGSGHHVFVPLDRAGATAGTGLPRLVRDAAEVALKEMGLNYERASDLATLARRSLPALRRKLAVAPGVQVPAWAQASEARALLAPLLVGAWFDSSEPDQDVLSRLSGLTYDQIRAHAVRWANEPDPPLIRVADVWMVASREDAWRLIARYLTADDLCRFESVALDVLAERDATQEMSEHERLLHSLRGGKSLRRSEQVREGITETLALMAALSDDVSFVSSHSGEETARRVVWSLLNMARADVRLWTTLALLLPLLAEAAPGVFLDAVEAGLHGEDPLLRGLFRDRDELGYNALFGWSPHTGLLWALETVAWKPEYLGRVALILAQLTRLDPGGHLANRPLSSLRTIFCPWIPNTTAPLKNRLAVLNALRRREPASAWKLMLHLLPERHSTMMPTHDTRWRDWRPDERTPITVQEYVEFTSNVLERLLSDAGVDAARWRNLFPRVGELLPEQRESLLTRLESLDVELFSSDGLAQMRAGLRKTIVRHREYPEAEWAMPAAHLDRLESVYERLRPEDLVARHLWLFEQYVEVPSLQRRGRWRECAEAIENLRLQALAEIWEAQGWDGVLRVAEGAQWPYFVGWTLERSGWLPVDSDTFLRENLAACEPWRNAMAQGFTSASIASHADSWEAWVEARLSAASGVSDSRTPWKAAQYGEFFRGLPFVPKMLDYLDALDESIAQEVQRYFWSRIQSVGLAEDAEQTDRVLIQLLRFHRSHIAVHALSWLLHGEGTSNFVTPERVAETLEAAGVMPLDSEVSSESASNFAHDSAELLNHLEKTTLPRERLAHLEFLYLRRHQHYRQPKFLHNELARSPEFFVDALKHVYAPNGESQDSTNEQTPVGGTAKNGDTEQSSESTESDQVDKSQGINEVDMQNNILLAMLIGDLLQSWQQIPGKREDGTFDGEVLREWVLGVRELAVANDRREAADRHIGQAFAFSPIGEDGAWPHEAVRDLIDELASGEIDSAWRAKIFNNRGVVSRGQIEGGQQERALVARYERDADAIADEWPHTAGVLREFAANYRRNAVREDQRAQFAQDQWR